MRTSSGLLRASPASLLLLGLLALLLWGQCGVLFSGSSRPARALVGEVSSTDSLRASPATLYLTLSLHNGRRSALVVQEVAGTLQWGRQSLPFAASPPRQALRPNATVRQSVAISLRGLRADSLALLRRTLVLGSLDNNTLRLAWHTSYTPTNASPNVDYAFSNLPPLRSPHHP